MATVTGRRKAGTGTILGGVAALVAGGVSLGTGIWLQVRAGYTEATEATVTNSRPASGFSGLIEVDVTYNPAQKGARNGRIMVHEGFDCPQGKKLKVRFHPEAPDVIGLERDTVMHGWSLFMIGMGSFLLLLGIVLILVGIRSRRSTPVTVTLTNSESINS